MPTNNNNNLSSKNKKSSNPIDLTKPFVLLNFNTQNINKFFYFSNFTTTITFKHNDNINDFFTKINFYIKKGYWISGYFTYEFGYHLDPELKHLIKKTSKPIAWVGISKKPKEISSKHLDKLSLIEKDNYKISKIKPNIEKKTYFSKIKQIKKYLKQGLTYQINFTFKLKFNFQGNILKFFNFLKETQPTSYTALIHSNNEYILSLSPELFFNQNKNKIVLKPMKGTIRRGINLKQDLENILEFKKSKKIKAENLMIVDLIRNDVSKISNKVNVPKLFEVEKYKTLFQMTSLVKAKLKKNIFIKDIFTSLFPSGSVTGAPKIKTIELINKLENEHRGIYTGSIGYISPLKESCFNICIRTLNINKNKGEMGIGGGIVYDSVDNLEFEEAILKSKFLTTYPQQFSLIETLLYTKKGNFFLLDLHLKRLKNSCDFFMIPLDLKKLKISLKKLVLKTKPGFDYKIRILYNQKDGLKITKDILVPSPKRVKIFINPKRINSSNTFLYFKTTLRDFYNFEREKSLKKNYFETIFMNERNEITEGTISNIFIKKNNILYTPLINSGILGGTYREYLLIKKKVVEKVLYKKDLINADKIYIGNSVMKLIEAKLA